MQLADGETPCADCVQYRAEWCCTMNCSTAKLRPPGLKDPRISEDWLASVGFKFREPMDGQPFRHWTLRFSEWSDHGFYIETTKPGWMNSAGEHVGKDGGWFVWIGREHKFIHTRHMFMRREMVALVEALAGQPWTPSKSGMVPVVTPHNKPEAL